MFDTMDATSQLHKSEALDPGVTEKRGLPVLTFRKRRQQPPRKPSGHRRSFGRAFDCDQDSPLEDIRKAVLSAAYLLEWGSECGNRDLPCAMADGLAHSLKLIAKDAGSYLLDVTNPKVRR